MRVLKAYADAGALNGQNICQTQARDDSKGGQQRERRKNDTGDSVRLSARAMEALENGAQGSVSLYAQDATYDQYGNITRQVDALRRDLSALALASPGMALKTGMLRSQLGSLRASV